VVAALDYGPNCELLETDLPMPLLTEAMVCHYGRVPAQPPDAPQNTVEWLEARKDRLTCSNFGKVAKRRVRSK